MEDERKPDPAAEAKPTQQAVERKARADRVAAALRENLLKRKQQSRARAESPDKD